MYDALDRHRCLNILTVYGLVPQEIWILRMYWQWFTMVGNYGGYYGPPFKDFYRVKQGKTISPIIFNVVV